MSDVGVVTQCSAISDLLMIHHGDHLPDGGQLQVTETVESKTAIRGKY